VAAPVPVARLPTRARRRQRLGPAAAASHGVVEARGMVPRWRDKVVGAVANQVLWTRTTQLKCNFCVYVYLKI